MELTSPQYWDSWWSSQPHIILKDNNPQYGAHGYFLKAMEKRFGPLNGKSVVELGGSTSYALMALAKYRSMCATAIDYSEKGIQESRRFFFAHGCSVELIHADFFSPELNHRHFDLVTHWGVLEHQIDPFPLIKRSVEFAAPGGKVIFAMPQMRGPGAWLWKKLSPKSWFYHIYHTDRAIISAFSSLGWTCRRTFWGEPFIHMTPCESTGWLAALAGFAQKWGRRSAILKIPYQYGMPYFSGNRGFVGWKN
jgi:2-polyprenyl-3-methyl-5-hydroxy-6-metoxy-1,4-benzoquinol methylase